MRKPRSRELRPLITWRLQPQDDLRLRRRAIGPSSLFILRLAALSAFVVLLGWWVFERIGVYLPTRFWLLLIGSYAGIWVLALAGLGWLAIRRKSHRYQLLHEGVRTSDELIKWDRFTGFAVAQSRMTGVPELVLHRRNGRFVRRPLPTSARQAKIIAAVAQRVQALPDGASLSPPPVPFRSLITLLITCVAYFVGGVIVMLWLAQTTEWKAGAYIVIAVIAVWLGPGTFWLQSRGKTWRRTYPQAISCAITANFGVWMAMVCTVVVIDIIELRRQGLWPPQDAEVDYYDAQ